MIRPAFAAEAPVSRRQPPEGPSHTASGYDTFGDHISYMSAKRAVKAARLRARNGRPVAPFALWAVAT
jgi:hypothetical protein